MPDTDPNERDAPDEEAGEPDPDTLETEVFEAAARGDPPPDRAATDFQSRMTGPRTPRDRIDTNELFELLASPGNRFVLTYLLRVDDPARYTDLVDYVVSRATVPEELTEGKFRGRVAAQLVHSTLPQLDDAGLIDHDPDDQSVAATPAVDAVAPYLALAISQLTAGQR